MKTTTNTKSKNLKKRNQQETNSKVKVSLTKGDQQEIYSKVDEHIDILSDGSLNCSICGKIDSGRRGKRDMRGHVETHLEGISYQCPLCEKTFRSRETFMKHDSHIHKSFSGAGKY